MGSQEDEISKLLLPSIYYRDCYAVGGYFVLDLCGFVGVKMTGKGFYMSVLKNSVLLRNRKAENLPLMKVICSLLLFAPLFVSVDDKLL
jgi:hypothetical protein